MRVSVIQMSPGSERGSNIEQMRDLIDRAVRADRPELVVLPEVWSCLGGTRAQKFDAAEELPSPGQTASQGSLHRALSDLARLHGLTLHAGSIGERAGDRLFNASLVFDPDGNEIARYRKIHLFDVETDLGHRYRESDTYAAGSALTTFQSDGITFGCAICYDLRFAWLFAALRDREVDAIVLPAAFTTETGAAHWEPLIRARAIETQSWVIAAATTGVHRNDRGEARHTYGHSMICDPWGTVVAQAASGIGWATARIDRELGRRIRVDMPVHRHRARPL